MRGNILTQTNWQVKAVFTLTVLFATTCLLLTNLTAQDYDSDEVDNDWDSGWAFQENNVFGSASVCTWYDAPFLKSSHCASISRSDAGGYTYYYTFEAKLTDPQGNEDVKDESNHGPLPLNYWSKSKSFSFLVGEGDHTINAFSFLKIVEEFGDGRSESWRATATTSINIEE